MIRRARLLNAFALSTALTATVAATPALAAPTEQVRGGATIVRLSDTFLGAVTTLGVDVAPEQSALLLGRYAAFPIPAGALDLEFLAGDILHSGGLSLSVPGTTVELLSFIIDTTSLADGNAAEDRVVITGLVTANGDVVDRLPLFDLVLNRLPQVSRSGRVTISNVDVLLSAEAAAALNSVFGVSAFTEGLPIGKAKVSTRVIRERRH